MDNEALVADMLVWISNESRPYDEVMDAWRTSCPRLTIWEDAVDNGFVRREFTDDQQSIVHVTPEGRNFLKDAGRSLN